MRKTLLALTLTVAALSSACDGEARLYGADEPVLVHLAELKKGKLPESNDLEQGPKITSLQLGFGVVNPGTPGLTLRGRTSGDAYAVGFRLLERGTGYWVQPLGAEDPTNPGELTYELTFDAASELPPGRYTAAVVAFDQDGKPGPQSQLSVCVASHVPDNLNSCDPAAEPPPAVISLEWNADADLDLTIEAPDGTRFDRRNRGVLRDGQPLYALDADGVSGCLSDGRRYENFVFYEAPASGTWLAYANLFDACGKPSVRFTLKVYRSTAREDGTFALETTETVHGEFVRAQANGGAGTALYLGAVSF